MRRRTAAILCFVWAGTFVAAGVCLGQPEETPAPPRRMSLSTNFPGGAAEVCRLDPERREIDIRPPLTAGRGWPCWWSFRLDGLTPGDAVTLRVIRQPQPYREQLVLDAAWCQPDQAAISSDNVRWSQTAPCERAPDGAAVYRFEAPGERVWLAWGPPFVPEDADALLSKIEAQLPSARRFLLARTRGDRAVPGIQIDEGGADQPLRWAIWVQARQHAWESGGSWVGRGFLEWAAGDAPAAQTLRRQCAIYFIPIMDVDNVAQGAGGKEALPEDHNRNWRDESIYPEVTATQERLRELDEQGRLLLFLDLHNPGPRDRQPFYYGPFPDERLDSPQQERFARWLAYSVEAIRGPLPVEKTFRVASYVKTDEERRRMSRNWVLDHCSGRVLGTTLETAWNTPHGTPEGYLTVGSQLGEVIARYVQSVGEETGAPGK